MPPNSDTPPAPEIIKITRPAKRIHVPRLVEWLTVGFVVLVLIGIALPAINSPCIKSPRLKALVQAKQIGLALKLFATDHDGRYPNQGVPPEMIAPPADANVAFACLFPTYIQNEAIFADKLSAYYTGQPDNGIDTPYTGTPKETLQPGENTYSYVMGINESDPPTMPLVAEGTDGHGHYCTDPKKRGGVGKGERAIVIRLDNSGALETLAGPADARFVPRDHEHPASNLFDFSNAGKPLTLLDPATGPRRK